MLRDSSRYAALIDTGPNRLWYSGLRAMKAPMPFQSIISGANARWYSGRTNERPISMHGWQRSTSCLE